MRSEETRNALVEAHVDLLPAIVANALGRAASSVVLREDNALHDEVISAAQLALLQAAENWDPCGGLGWATWLCMLVRARCADALRAYADMPRGMREEGRRVLSLDAVLGEDEAPADAPAAVLVEHSHPGERIDHWGETQEAAVLLAEMPDDELCAVCMHFADGMSTREIARKLGCHASKVKAMIWRALRGGGPSYWSHRRREASQ